MHTFYDPLWLYCKITVMITFFVGMNKLVVLLRIFESFAPIVAMMYQVVGDLFCFIVIFMILTLMFSQQFGIIGVHR